MHNDFTVSAVLLVLGLAIVALAFTFPTLTFEGGASSVPGISQAVYEANLAEEAAYCSGQADDINCACFAQTSAMIRSYDTPKALGFNYSDQTELARMQAANRC